MNSREIRQQFALESSQWQSDLSRCSENFADWIAAKAPSLSHTDLKLLMQFGGALYVAELEQNWQQSWS